MERTLSMPILAATIYRNKVISKTIEKDAAELSLLCRQTIY